MPRTSLPPPPPPQRAFRSAVAGLCPSSPARRSAAVPGRRAGGGPGVARAFAQLVSETQLELEKRVLRGEAIDAEMLQLLRVIAVETAEYVEDV